MNKRLVSAALSAAGLVLAVAPGASAAPAAGTTNARSCEGVTLSGSLPVPPAGLAVQQTVTIGEDCKPQEGPVTYVPATTTPVAKSVKAAAAAGATTGKRQISSWNQMFDCCNIRMTGLYTTSDWNTADGRVTSATTVARQEFNREPWDAGWSVKSATSSDDCTTDCAVVNSQAHADFGYKGIFDVTGGWYGNTHHTYLTLNPDLTSSCTFDVQLKHTFIGWNWQHGCQ
ncbi:hypothetical protein OG535_31775 [Kitasatospora sp. NBC_00085]|uniref:hypothetical protein n=1 Tax=unclassified Kitasatospora TaxID=2633591 RepID=UPI00324C2315